MRSATTLIPPCAGSLSMRALWAVSLLLAPIVGGCVSPAEPAEPASAPDLGGFPLMNLTRSLGVDLSRWSGEPSILALADGTLLVTGAGGFTRFAENPADIPGNFGQSYIWRSVDQGATWSFVDLGLPGPAAMLAPYRNAILGVEGDLAEDEAGRAYFVDLTMLVTNGLAASDDSGASWTAAQSPVIGAPPADRPWVAAMGEGVVYVKYLGNGGHRVARSTNGGATFPEDVAIPDCGQGAPIVDFAEHEVVIPCVSGATLSLLRTAEGTQQWQPIPVLEAEGPAGNVFTSVAVAGARQYVYAYAETVENLTRVRAAATVDGGDTWGEPIPLSTADRTGVFPWVDANANGTVAVVWYEADQPGASDTIDAAWFPMHASLRIAPDGNLTLGPILALSAEKVHQGSICTSGLGCVLDGRAEDRRLLDFFEVDVDATGTSHVAFTTTQTDVPTVWYAQVAPS